jgi:hypothetical protein
MKTTINIDGVDYEVDLSEAIKQGLIKRQISYKRGQKFRGPGGDYILAQTAPNYVALIGLDCGNRHKDPIKVDHNQRITEQEFNLMCGRSVGKFTLIS